MTCRFKAGLQKTAHTNRWVNKWLGGWSMTMTNGHRHRHDHWVGSHRHYPDHRVVGHRHIHDHWVIGHLHPHDHHQLMASCDGESGADVKEGQARLMERQGGTKVHMAKTANLHYTYVYVYNLMYPYMCTKVPMVKTAYTLCTMHFVELVVYNLSSTLVSLHNVLKWFTMYWKCYKMYWRVVSLSLRTQVDTPSAKHLLLDESVLGKAFFLSKRCRFDM